MGCECEKYDLIIIGGGAAGLTAGIYGVRSKLKTLLLEKLPLMGGQIVYSEKVENYPGFPEGISGVDLTALMETQARGFGLEIKTGEVIGVKDDGDIKRVLCDGEEYLCRAIIIATGASPNRLGIEGEEHFIGKGISFCGTCDGFFFKDLEVIVVGGETRLSMRPFTSPGMLRKFISFIVVTPCVPPRFLKSER